MEWTRNPEYAKMAMLMLMCIGCLANAQLCSWGFTHHSHGDCVKCGQIPFEQYARTLYQPFVFLAERGSTSNDNIIIIVYMDQYIL